MMPKNAMDLCFVCGATAFEKMNTCGSLRLHLNPSVVLVSLLPPAKSAAVRTHTLLVWTFLFYRISLARYLPLFSCL